MKLNKKEIIDLCILVTVTLSLLIGLMFFSIPQKPESISDPTPSFTPIATEAPTPEPTPTPSPVPLPAGFVYVTDVVPDVIVNLKYYSTDNFVGRRIPGYEANKAILTEEAALALAKAAEILAEDGYRIVICDAYRPTDAVDYFVAWGNDPDDLLMKEKYYPNLTKKELFGMYIGVDHV